MYLKGDAKPHRIWMIQDMTETASRKQIFTLITNDHEGLRPQERIQVVNHTRIEPIPAHDTSIESSESMQGGGGSMGQSGRMPFLGEMNTMGMNNGMPNIIISPTMINGNNNNGMQGDGMDLQGGDGMMSQNTNMPLPPISLNSMGSRPMAMQAQVQAPQAEEKKSKGWIQSAIDFTKELVIKKV